MDTDAIIAEHSTTRSEILQLNGQIFIALTTSLGLNVTVIGWIFTKEKPADYIYLFALGAFVLLLGNILILNKNRLAHRLAYFQKFLIEPYLPGIQWAKAGFAYRKIYQENRPEHDLMISMSEHNALGAKKQKLNHSVTHFWGYISLLKNVSIFHKPNYNSDPLWKPSNQGSSRAKINPKSWNWEKSHRVELGSNLDYFI